MTVDYGNYGIFLIMGIAASLSSTGVVFSVAVPLFGDPAYGLNFAIQNQATTKRNPVEEYS